MATSILTAEQIASQCDDKPTNRANRGAINKLYRKQDDSHLYPINNRFNVTDKAISRAQWFNREAGCDMAGLEYALFIEDMTGFIVSEG